MAIALVVLAIPLPLALLFGLARTTHVFRDGGAGMYGLVFLSLAVAGAVGTCAVFAVRGARGGALGATIAPAVPAVIGALLGVVAMRRALDAVAGLDADPDLRVRILGAGMAESDALPAYGTLIAAVMCGAAACALLAGGASVDRAQHNAPAGNGWALPAAIGGLGFIVAVGLRLVLRGGFATMLVSLPSILIVTTLACLAATNGPLVRHWREPRETDAWIAAVLGAAVLAGVGFALLEIGASFASEARDLAAISSDSVDPSQRARILAEVVEEQSTYRTLAIADGLFGFMAVVPAALSGLARSSDGRLRFPRGAPILVALAGALAVIASLLGARTWLFGQLGAAAEVHDTSFELPRVPISERLAPPPLTATVLRIDEHGKSTTRNQDSDLLIVDADRRATWLDVSSAIKEVRAARPGIRTIDVRVTLLAKADRSELAPYGVLLGNETSVLHIALAAPGGARVGADDDDGIYDGGRTALRFRDFELMDAIAAAIARRPMTVPAHYGGRTSTDVTIFPSRGSW